jgi:cytochrome c554/c'-like protein
MKKSLFVFTLLGIGILFFGLSTAMAATDHQLVGAPKCKMCHGAKIGNQWKIWTESAHAGAFETLASDASKKIAAEKGLGDPQKEAECLKCHATQAFLGGEVTVSAKGKYADSEGVGCESCHGAGADYKKVMKNHDAAVAAGLATELGEELCTKCHNETSPTFKSFDYTKQWAEIEHPVVKKKK